MARQIESGQGSGDACVPERKGAFFGKKGAFFSNEDRAGGLGREVRK